MTAVMSGAWTNDHCVLGSVKLHIKFRDGSVVELILFQNDAVTRWFRHFRQINSNGQYYTPWWRNSLEQPPASAEYIDQRWQQIKSAITELRQLGYHMPFAVADQFDHDQTTLNRLHRFFTYNVMWCTDLASGNHRENPFDPNFNLPSDMNLERWLDLVDPINQAVHDLESLTRPHENRTFIQRQHPLSLMTFMPVRKSHTDLSTWLPFSPEDQRHNFREYMHLESSLVTLNPSILGKSVLQSFYDNDDPTALDCTGRLGSFGGFEVELNDARKKIYRSGRFQQWIAQHGMQWDCLPLEFPIGHMPDAKQQSVLLLTKRNLFHKVEFVE